MITGGTGLLWKVGMWSSIRAWEEARHREFGDDLCQIRLPVDCFMHFRSTQKP